MKLNLKNLQSQIEQNNEGADTDKEILKLSNLMVSNLENLENNIEPLTDKTQNKHNDNNSSNYLVQVNTRLIDMFNLKHSVNYNSYSEDCNKLIQEYK